MKRLSLFFVMIVFSMALVLVGAHQSPAAPATVKPTSPATPTPQYGGVLKMLWAHSPAVFGYPAEVAGLSTLCAVGVAENLLDFDKQLRFQPGSLATGFEVAKDGRSAKITLRKGVKFHDGTDFNAAAVKWNLDRILESKQLGTEVWTSIDVIDNFTVRINLKHYDSAFPSVLGRTTGQQISPTAVERNGIEWARYRPVGTGPFKFKSFDRDISLKYERFDDYWGGKPYLDGIEYYFVKDQMVQEASFRAGEAQVIYYAEPLPANNLKKQGYQVISAMTSMAALSPDSANPNSPLSNQKVREALEYAIDRNVIADSLGYGYWRGTDQPCIPEIPLGYNKAIKGREYNPAKAKQLLAEAGYAKGFKTKITTPQGLMPNQDPVVAIQRYWKDVGVDTTLEFISRNAYDQLRMKGWTDGFVFVGMALDPMYLNTLDRFLSISTKVYVSTTRPAGWNKAFMEARSAIDPEVTARLTQELVKKIHDEASFLPLWGYSYAFVVDKSLHDAGFLTSHFHYFYWTPEKAWLSK
jgi:peptide/nickel transport system substrate-binding protein